MVSKSLFVKSIFFQNFLIICIINFWLIKNFYPNQLGKYSATILEKTLNCNFN